MPLNKSAIASVTEVRKENVFVKGMLTGTMVIAEMLTGGLFLENLKMQKQLLQQPYPQVARTMLGAGLGGFWGGFWPWGAALGLSKGIVLGAAKSFWGNVLLDHTNMSQSTIDFVAGTLAGGCQGIVMSPCLLARTRVNEGIRIRIEEQGIKSKGVSDEFRLSMNILNNAVKQNGFRTFFIGMETMVLKRMGDWGLRFFMMGRVKQAYYNLKFGVPDGDEIKHRLKAIERLGCTFFGSASSVLFLQPLDKLMPVIQSEKPPGVTIQSILRQQIANKGFFRTFWSGTAIRLVHIGWHTSWAIFVSQEIYDYVYPKDLAL